MIRGDRADPYFCNIQAIADSLASLAAWIRSNLPPDAIVIDAGGNIGLTALLMATLLPKGHVHVFEALPTNADHLRYNVSRNKIMNCTVNSVALGAEVGTTSMQGSGSSSHILVDPTCISAGTIPMVTLDSYAREIGLERVDFIKMDIEGFEPAVLEGGRVLIKRFAPPIMMEFNSWCLTFIQGYNARDFACSLWDSFEVMSVDKLGKEQPAGGGSAAKFLHDNVVLHGTVEDVLLRLKPNASISFQKSPAQFHAMPAATQELEKLKMELDAMRKSTSWKMTLPLRALGQLIRKRPAKA